jgi:3-deoxy-D-manno-octulosonate 8-phosphate phosphatase (KDO 8-P phosphatase)
MTDGGLYFSDSGEEFKRFNSLDGHGIKMLRASGVEVAIITGRTSHCVEARAKNLGITHVFQGVENKLEAMVRLLNKLKISRDAAAYMGDDVVDLTVMRHVGLAISVPESPLLVRKHSHYVTQRGGGHGAVREACELIMSAQDTLDAQLAPYLQ